MFTVLEYPPNINNLSYHDTSNCKMRSRKMTGGGKAGQLVFQEDGTWGEGGVACSSRADRHDHSHTTSMGKSSLVILCLNLHRCQHMMLFQATSPMRFSFIRWSGYF